MTTNSGPDKPSKKSPEPAANEMDWPLPGSDGPVPTDVASGVAEPIEVAEQAGGIDPGSPSPTQGAKADPASEQQKR